MLTMIDNRYNRPVRGVWANAPWLRARAPSACSLFGRQQDLWMQSLGQSAPSESPLRDSPNHLAPAFRFSSSIVAFIVVSLLGIFGQVGCVTLKDVEESQSKHSRRAAEDMDRFAATIKDELRAIKLALDGALREARVEAGVAIKAQSEDFANITATLRAILKELQQPRNGRKISKNAGDLRVTRVSANRFRVSRKQIEETGVDVDRLVSNIEAESIVLNGGRQAGLKILRNDALGEKIGIKAGDVLQRVNGIAVASVEEAHKIAPSLRKTANVRLDLIRNGAPVQIHIQVEK